MPGTEQIKTEHLRHAATAAVRYVETGMVVGLGTGRASRLVIEELGRRIREEKLDIKGIPTSAQSADSASHEGIPLVELNACPEIDLLLDGANEVSPSLQLTKGRWGALYREKVVASAARQFIIVVDESKLVQRLGTRSAVPVEVAPFGARRVAAALTAEIGCKPVRRDVDVDEEFPFFTESNNYIFDCYFENGIPDPVKVEQAMNQIPGAIVNGLFVRVNGFAVIGLDDGVRELRCPKA